MIITLTDQPFEPGALVTAFCADRQETGAVATFVGPAPLSDDLTCLVLRYSGEHHSLPAFAVAAGLLVYPQAAHLEHFEPRRTRHLMTTGGYMARVGRWLRESF